MKEHYNQSIFDNGELWENYDEAGEIKAKIPLIMNQIPGDVSSIIDVGCGNGEITNQFPEHYRVLGVDLSEEALKHVSRENVKCSCDDLHMVDDLEFDMVFSSELIEHLPTEILHKTIAEFKRVSGKYVFISVPNREQLAHYNIKCPSCGLAFHAYGHLHSFTPEKISALMGEGYELIWNTTSGKTVREYNPGLLSVRHRFAGKYFAPSQYTVCPQCGNREYPEHRGNLLSKICNGLNKMMPAKKKEYWLMTLFEKK